MKTVLDLIAEFAELNDAKIRSAGRLTLDAERRFTELKAFYDHLMTQTGVVSRRVSRSFSAKDVVSKVPARERLRVPLETETIFSAEGEYHTGVAVNVSRGGLCLSVNHVLPVNSDVTIYLSSSATAGNPLIETRAKVIWVGRQGASPALTGGMGVSFVEKKEAVERYLDSIVVESLVRHLSRVDTSALAPELIDRDLVLI